MVERADQARRLTEAHVAVHRRDPQTFAYAMADSPAGLGAWLWHRRQLWCDGDALEVFGRDDLCTLSSLYWFNTSMASSIRLYAEEFSKPSTTLHDRPRVIDVPTGFGVFAKELLFIPRAIRNHDQPPSMVGVRSGWPLRARGTSRCGRQRTARVLPSPAMNAP